MGSVHLNLIFTGYSSRSSFRFRSIERVFIGPAIVVVMMGWWLIKTGMPLTVMN